MDIESIPGPLLRIVETVGTWQNPVLSRTLNTPPTATGAGARYLLDGGAPTGAWAGHAGYIAEDIGGITPWLFTAPAEGMTVFVRSTGKLWIYSSGAWGPESAASGSESTADKNLPALATAGDYDPALASAISSTPLGYVTITVNGQEVVLGDGARTADCYFSGDSGATARSYGAVVAGDVLHWIGSIAGYQLAPSDVISLHYEV